MWHYGDWGWMNFGMHGLGMILFWGLIVLALVVLVRSLIRPAAQQHSESPPDPLDFARRRYASGELSLDQFTSIKKNLEG